MIFFDIAMTSLMRTLQKIHDIRAIQTKLCQYATTENPAPPIPDVFDEYYTNQRQFIIYTRGTPSDTIAMRTVHIDDATGQMSMIKCRIKQGGGLY